MESVIEAVLGVAFWVIMHPVVSIVLYLLSSLVAEISAIVLKRGSTRFWKVPFITALSGYITLPPRAIIWLIRLVVNVRSFIAKRIADGRFEDRGVVRK